MTDHFKEAQLKFAGTPNEYLIHSTSDPNDNDYSDVFVDGGSRRIATVPVSQIQNNIWSETLVKVEPTAPYSTKLASPDSITFQIDRTKCATIDSLYLDIVLTIATGTCVLTAKPRIFDRIEFTNQANTVIRTLHPEDLLYFGKSFLSEASRKQILKQMGTNEKYEVCKYNEYDTVGTHPYRIYLPFPKEFPLCATSGIITVTLYVNSITTDWLVSGTLSYITLSRCWLMLKSGQMPQYKIEEIVQEYRSKPHMRKYLEYPWYRESVAMTTSSATDYTIDLKAFNGQMSAVYLGLRPAKTALNSEEYFKGFTAWLEDDAGTRYYYAGDLTGDDLVNGVNIGNRQGNSLHDHTNILKWNFASDEEKTEENEIDTGSVYMNGNWKLKIRTSTSSTEVNSSQLVTLDATATSGTYCLQFGSSTSAPIAYDATATTIDSEIAKMQSVIDADIKVASTTTLNAGGKALTLTISHMKKYNENHGNSSTGANTPNVTGGVFSMVNNSMLQTATAVVVTYTSSADGNAKYGLGNATGSTFIVDVFMRKHNVMTIERDGFVSVNKT
jgi:hypothetical protein